MQKTQMKKKSIGKIRISIALFAFCFMVCCPFLADAAEETAIGKLDDVYITGFFKEAPQRQLHWTYAGSGYAKQPYFFIPSGIDSDTVQIWFASAGENPDGSGVQEGYVTINGARVHSGDSIRLPQDGGKIPITVGNGTVVSVGVKRSAKLASMFIDTASGNMNQIHADKSNKEKGDILLVRGDGALDYQGTLKHIKGRGNATWNMDKKPYNIKLDESADLLGMGSAKGWCLLANYGDTSLLRNHVIYNLAEEAGIEFTMDSRSIDLYLNGTYNGTYLMTEKIEIGKNRVNITDMEKATEKVNSADLDSYPAGGKSWYQNGGRKWVSIPNDPADITGGYLIEIELDERYAAEACGFVTTRGQAVTMKAPEFVSKNQIDYIADLYQKMEDAIYSGTGYNAEGKHFSEYIDEESIARMYLLQEYSMNLDTGITSFYLYKDSDTTGDGKFHMAPVWDFDMSTGNYGYRNGVDLTNPELWWANRATIYNKEELNILAKAIQYESVEKLATEQWNDIFYPIIRACLEEEEDVSLQKLKTLTEYQKELSTSAGLNFLVWPDALKHWSTGVQSGKDFADSVKYLRNFLERREAFIHKKFAYGGTGGYDVLKGTVSIEGTLRVGETIAARVKDSNAKAFIYQWKADGENIPEASDEIYLLTEADLGKVISVEVKAEDKKLLKSLYGSTDSIVQNPEPEPETLTGTVSIEGTMKVGEEITAQVKESNARSFTYQWMADGVVIAGATEAVYRLTENEAGKIMSVEVKAAEGLFLNTLPGIADERVQALDPEPETLTGTVSIEGTMKVGEEITLQVKESNARSFTYQWMADGVVIAGATEAVYRLTENEAGKIMSVEVKAAEGLFLNSLLGVADKKVQALNPDPNPGQNTDSDQIINPSPTVLAASDVTSITSTKAGVKIQFGKTENASSYEIYRKVGNKLQKIATVKETSYTDVNPVGGKSAVYMVKAVSGDLTKFTDAAFGAAKSVKLPNVPKNVKAKAQKDRKVCLSWKKVKGASAYLIYRADSKNGKYKVVKTVKKPGTTAYTDKKNLKKNKKYYYKIIVLKNGKYSPASNAVKVWVKK